MLRKKLFEIRSGKLTTFYKKDIISYKFFFLSLKCTLYIYFFEINYKTNLLLILFLFII